MPAPNARAAYVWEQVGGTGLGDATNTTVATMYNWNNVLYAGVGNNLGGRIYRSTNGATWTKVNTDGFGHPHLREIYDFFAFGGQLYASSLDDQFDDTPGEIWRSVDGVTWTQAGGPGLGNLANTGFYKFETFGGMLYVTSRNPTEGGEILRSADGAVWTQVNIDGFGSALNDAVMSLESFGGLLYAGTFNPTAGAELWRSDADGDAWDKVIDFDPYPGGLNQGINTIFTYQNFLHFVTLNPADGAQLWYWSGPGIIWTGFVGGMGDANNIWFSIQPLVLGDTLYLGTRNHITGAELFTETPGPNFSQILPPGIGDVNNWALYAITFKDYVYIAYSNNNGAQIWRRLATSDFYIITKSLPDGTQGQSYFATVQADHGNPSYRYRVLSGALPKGLNLDTNTGEISGVPQESGDFRVEIEAWDSSRNPARARKIFRFKIVAGESTGGGIENVQMLPQTGADLH